MNDRDMCCGPAWYVFPSPCTFIHPIFVCEGAQTRGAYPLEMAPNRFLLESDQASWTPEAASPGSVEQHMCDAVMCVQFRYAVLCL